MPHTISLSRRSLLAAPFLLQSAFAQEEKTIKLGFIALTDSAPLIIAQEKGFFAKYNVKVELIKQASWGAVRDNLVLGGASNGLDGSHILTPMAYLMAAGKISAPLPLNIVLRLNTQGQGISLEKSIKDPAQLKGQKVAMTFKGGTHDLWLRYWLASQGLDPDKDLSLQAVPPPQMVANMRVGALQAFCVGEPWNAQLEAQDLGYTALRTGQIWAHHPEKSLVLREDFVTANPQTVQNLIKAVLEAQKWCSAAQNLAELAVILSKRSNLNVPVADIEARLPDMGFTQSYPYQSHDQWFLLENIRWGNLPKDLPLKSLIEAVNKEQIWRGAAAALNIMQPQSASRGLEKFFDGAVYDPDKPMDWLNAQKISRLRT